MNILLDSLWQDVRYALRTLRKNPVFVLTAVLTLALAIGGNTAMFTVIRAVMLKPLQYPEADRLVSLLGGATPTRFAEMRAASRSFSALAAYTSPENVTLSGMSEPEVLKAVRVSADFLRVTRQEPFLGRTFRSEEDLAGGAPVAMISAELWQRRFAGDPHVAGRTVTLAATAYSIIGVLPPHFQFPFPDLDVWLTAPAEEPLIAPRSRTLSPFLSIAGRLKPGVTVQQAGAELKVLRHQYALAHPAMLDSKPKPVEVTTLKDGLVGNVRTMLLLLFGAVGLVLLIACANVASLLLARATSRSRELAVRSALGAARARVIRQLLAESVLLSLSGGILGFLLAGWALRLLVRIDSQLPRAGEIHLDWMVLTFTAALSIATGILFGLAPSLGASRPDLMSILRASSELAAKDVHTRILSRLNVRSLLVAGQIALSIVLLIGTALLVESIAHLRHLDMGFNSASLLTAHISLPPLRYDTNQKRDTFYENLARNAQTLPGVRSAAVAWVVPTLGYPGTPVQDAAQPPLPLNQRPIEVLMDVTPAYFQTFQIPLRRGRDFNSHDTADSQHVTIIDEGLARQFWPSYPNGPNPVGKHIFIGINPKPAEIVGIAGNVRQALEGNAWPGTAYQPFAQQAPQSAVMAARTEGDPLRFANVLRQQVRALDADQSIADVRTMDALVEEQVGQRRLLMILLESFSGAALLLALIGIYGVIAYAVSQRTQEVGIRRALGADQSDILWLVLRQALAMMLLGIALGLGGAFALTRLLTALLFHVSPTDPVIFATIAALFLVIALAASYIPARRASKIDPMAALRV